MLPISGTFCLLTVDGMVNRFNVLQCILIVSEMWMFTEMHMIASRTFYKFLLMESSSFVNAVHGHLLSLLHTKMLLDRTACSLFLTSPKLSSILIKKEKQEMLILNLI